MDIIFIGTTGVHHVLLAAHFYLYNTFPLEWNSVKHFGDVNIEEEGLPIYVDNDSNKNRIFVLGVGSNLSMVKMSIQQLVSILGKSEKELLVKPITIRGEKIILFQNRLALKRKQTTCQNKMIKAFIKTQIPIIKKQVLDFKNHNK